MGHSGRLSEPGQLHLSWSEPQYAGMGVPWERLVGAQGSVALAQAWPKQGATWWTPGRTHRRLVCGH